jgi:prepilin-type N-terminal cleavage/methylation domain-containing protein
VLTVSERRQRWRIGYHPLYRHRRAEDGYTLIEALAALAVIGAGLAAIGQLGFTTVRAAYRAQTRLELTAATRKVLTAVASAQTDAEGRSSGQTDGVEWRLQYAPFLFDVPGAPPHPSWTPQAMRVMVRAVSGAEIVVDTVRLRPASSSR